MTRDPANIPAKARNAVRAQYEALPYPARNPADEKQRLLRTWLDDLPMVNHHCFAGRNSFTVRRLGLPHQPNNANHADSGKLLRSQMLGW